MADYIYLLENRLSETQKAALTAVRNVARGKGLTIFLVGGAVRDLTSGSPVRDLDVVVQGSALKLRKEIEATGASIAGSSDSTQALFVRFPGGVRLEIGSTLSVTYPKPGKPVYRPATILEDLRRRDFTANAMALSLNDGSYGLLMDPLNGVADIENRELRLTGNYGFIEDPVRMIRAIRFAARLGWELEEKTRTRYETGKQEGYISALDAFHRGYETEEIVHEEDPLRIMRRLEAEGWMQILAPGWTTAKANLTELDKVRESQTQLQMQGIFPDASAVNFPLLTAKMAAKEVEALKKSFPRPGFVAEIESMETDAKEFATALSARSVSLPSAAYRMMVSAKPEALLYVSYTTKSGALQAKIKSFLTEWPQARQKIPYVLMQEMRITPDLLGYQDLVEKLFFELMDGRLTSTEEMKAFLEPFSPPAPPPPVHVRRARASKKDVKGKGKAKKDAVDLDDEEDLDPADLDAAQEDARRGAEEDEEAEDAAEDFNAVAELGGGSPARSDPGEEEEDEEEEEPAAPRASSPAKKAAVTPKTPSAEPTAPQPSSSIPVSAAPTPPAPKGTHAPAAKPKPEPHPVPAKAATKVTQAVSNQLPAKPAAESATAAKSSPLSSKSTTKIVAIPAKAVAAKAVPPAKGKPVAPPAKSAKNVAPSPKSAKKAR